jgi:hypothetical protein
VSEAISSLGCVRRRRNHYPPRHNSSLGIWLSFGSCQEESNKHLIKIKLALYLIEHHAIETYGEVEYGSIINNRELDGGEWSALRSCRFILGQTPLGSYKTGGWVGLRAGLEAGWALQLVWRLGGP